MKIALLGLPQSGKRTLFSLLTGRPVPGTRKPGELFEGIAAIRDPRIEVLSRLCKPEKTTFAQNIFALAPDVDTGGTERAWLDASRKCDLLCLVVRAFASDAVFHPAGSVDPDRDLANLRAELMLADMEIVEKRLVRLEKEKKAGQTTAQVREEAVLRRCMTALEADQRLDTLAFDAQEAAVLRNLELVTMIPMLAMFNVSEGDLARPVPPAALAVSCQIEQEIMTIQETEARREFLESLGLKESGVDRVNAAAYAALGLMSFYTQGPDEVRAWTIRRGSPAPVAGGKIHSDIERGFIRVEIIKYDDFVAAGSEKVAKESGKLQLKGKDYVMEDGDICHFLFNV